MFLKSLQNHLIAPLLIQGFPTIPKVHKRCCGLGDLKLTKQNKTKQTTFLNSRITKGVTKTKDRCNK
jgi:hypothetical protein